MSFISNFKEKLFFFKYELVKPGSRRCFEQLKKDQLLPPDEIEALNWKRTLALFQYAFEHVPYYHRRYTEAGCSPQDIRTPEDFAKLPVLTRKDLMDNFDDLLSDEVTLKDVRLSTTGGSSGTPVKVYHPRKEIRAANGWRMLGWWNISPAADYASVYRDVRNSFKGRLLHFLQCFPTKQILLNATSFTEKDIRVFLDDFARVRPELLHGYVGAMDILAEYVLEHDIQLPPPKVIWVTSAPITHVQQKKIETAFHAPVYDQYGCCEIYWLAAECPVRNGLHMFYDTRRFEFLDDDNRPVPNGTFGNIALTDLQNYAFPLIRYLNGDRGRRLEHLCTCGCNLPLMDKVQGRLSDTLVLPSHTKLNALTTLFDNAPDAVKQFQVHQLEDASIVIRVVPNNSYPKLDKVLEEVRSSMEAKAKQEVPVSIEKVTHIPLLAGKMKFVISDYKPESPSEIDQTNPNHHRTACATTSGQCHLQSLQASQLSSRLKASFPCLSFISNFKEKLFFFKYELVKPGSRRCFEQMQKDQFLPPDEIEELNWKRTHALLQHAFEHVPYYRRRYAEAGISLQDIRTPEDFAQLPVLTRQDLMNNFDDLLSEEVSLKDVRLSTTGGSSGNPAKVYHPKKEIRAASGWRMLGWWNISPAADCADVYRDVHNSFKARIMHLLQWFPTKQILLDATSFTEKDMRDFLNKFTHVRPEVLHGYVGALDILAQYVLEHGIQLPPPKVIWVTSAPITPVQQKKIETAFNAPVYDQYGCCEIYWLAAECPARNGLHMFYDTRRFEFLDDDNRPVPNGEYGNIAITDLQNYAFPLIRYLNGDRGRRLDKRCTCGCNLPLMDKVKGRVSETFTLPSKTHLNGEFLTTLFDNTPEAVRQFQVHQLADASIVVRVIPNNTYPNLDETLEHVRSTLEEAVHGEVAVTLERVTEIPLQKGKMKFVLSDYKA